MFSHRAVSRACWMDLARSDALVKSHPTRTPRTLPRNVAASGSNPAARSTGDGFLFLKLQRTIGNQAVQRMNAPFRLQRVYLLNGTKVTDDAFDYTLPGIEPKVKVISFTKRHTIKGFAQGGTTKAINTVLLKAVEMTTVAADAYTVAWKTIDVTGNEKGPLATYLGWRARDKSHEEAEKFALGLVTKKGGSVDVFNKCVLALIAMNEIGS